MKFTFYLTITLIALGIMAANPTFIKADAKGKLNLCKLREGNRGSVTGIIAQAKDYKTTSVTDPKTGCSALVISKDFPQELQRGIKFSAIVQAGLLQLPSNIDYQDNLGEIKTYQEIGNYIRTKPRNIREKNRYVIDLHHKDGKKLPLYISKDLAKKIKMGEYNTFQYDSNNTVQSVSN